jgi:hypothetical protein
MSLKRSTARLIKGSYFAMSCYNNARGQGFKEKKGSNE